MTRSKTLYRGVRLSGRNGSLPSQIRENGMKYYWSEPADAIKDIFKALEKFNKISKIGIKPILRNYILEAGRINRLQIWATEDKLNAESYARATPELIFLALDQVVERKLVTDYLNSFYGEPHVVTFQVDAKPEYDNINICFGKFVPAENIVSIEPVDITKPDPIWRCIPI